VSGDAVTPADESTAALYNGDALSCYVQCNVCSWSAKLLTIVEIGSRTNHYYDYTSYWRHSPSSKRRDMDEVRQVTQRLQDHRLVEEHSDRANITSSQVCIRLVYDISPGPRLLKPK